LAIGPDGALYGTTIGGGSAGHGIVYKVNADGTGFAQGGVEFPGGARPAYSDFAYLAFTVGMCFQVSDTSVTSPQICRSALLHAVMSFAYTIPFDLCRLTGHAQHFNRRSAQLSPRPANRPMRGEARRCGRLIGADTRRS